MSDIKVCIFCLAKREELYIEEFIEYHLGIGFDYIYLYDNEDMPTYEKILVRYLSKVKVIHLPGNNYTESIQSKIMNDFKTKHMYTQDFTHAIHIDIDEFILLKKHTSMKEFIKDFIKNDCGAITINWKYFGSSNNTKYENKPLTERFTMCKKDYTEYFKVLFEINKFKWFVCAHNVFLKNGYFVKDTNGRIIKHNACNYDLKEDNFIQLNHYAAKTLPEFLYQRKRGVCNYKINDENYPKFNDETLTSDFYGRDFNDYQDTHACEIYKEIKKNKKYLWCKAGNGLNDMLCAMNDCYNYCCKYNRILLIDTKYSFIAESFDKYFCINNKSKIIIIINSTEIFKILTEKKLSVYPNMPQEDFCNYNEESILNHNIDYKEDVILYNYWAAGSGSFQFIELLGLNHEVKKEFESRYSCIPNPYTAAHLRFTDKIHYSKNKGELLDFYEQNKSTIESSNFFLATDSFEVLKYFKNLNIKMFSFIKCLNEQVKDNDVYGIHYSLDTNKNQVMIDTICDLLILGLSKKIIFHKIHSGFTNLAIYLNNNKNIIYQILDYF